MEKKNEYIHKGFSQEGDFRVFRFERLNPEGTLARFTIRANMPLSRRYGISLQELPLLCKAVLEASPNDGQRLFEFTEESMCLHAKSIKVPEPRKPTRSGRTFNPDGTARVKTIETDPPRERPVGFPAWPNR